jgi:hypothetical protein
LKLLQPSLDGLSSRCLFSIFPTVTSLDLNNLFCLPVPQHRYCLLLGGGGGTVILHSSAVNISAAIGRTINTKHFQRFFRAKQSASRYL